jgi:hypothetical protein
LSIFRGGKYFKADLSKILRKILKCPPLIWGVRNICPLPYLLASIRAIELVLGGLKIE